MIKATYQGKVIAHSNNTILLEDNYYFPEDDAREIKDYIAFDTRYVNVE